MGLVYPMGLNILHIIPYLAPKYGGEVVACLNLAKAQVDLGHKVDILTTDFELDRPMVEGTGIGLIPMRCLLHYGLARYAPQLKGWMRKNAMSYDAVHSHCYMSHLAIVSSSVCDRLGVAFFLQTHNSLRAYGGKSTLQTYFDAIWGKTIIRMSTRLLAYGEKERVEYIELGADPSKISILRNGIDFMTYSDLPTRGSFRQAYGIGADEVLFTYLGRLDPIKRVDLLINAFALLKKDNVRLVIIGPDTGDEDRLKGIHKESGLGDRVLFIGSLYGKDKIQALVDSDVFAIVSVSEGFSIAALEAAACELPVIMTKNSPVSDLMDLGMGISVGDSTSDILSAMQKLMDKEERERMGLFGRDYVRNELDWANIAQTSESIYLDGMSRMKKDSSSK